MSVFFIPPKQENLLPERRYWDASFILICNKGTHHILFLGGEADGQKAARMCGGGWAGGDHTYQPRTTSSELWISYVSI